MISFEKINVVPKISRVEMSQVYNLRFFLQLLNHPQRKLDLQRLCHKLSSSELAEERKVVEYAGLLGAFAKDNDLAVAHLVEWNQVYRYDYFLKVIPVSEVQLTKIFSDDH